MTVSQLVTLSRRGLVSDVITRDRKMRLQWTAVVMSVTHLLRCTRTWVDLIKLATFSSHRASRGNYSVAVGEYIAPARLMRRCHVPVQNAVWLGPLSVCLSVSLCTHACDSDAVDFFAASVPLTSKLTTVNSIFQKDGNVSHCFYLYVSTQRECLSILYCIIGKFSTYEGQGVEKVRSLTQCSRKRLQQLKTSKSAIADKPRCNVGNLWQK